MTALRRVGLGALLLLGGCTVGPDYQPPSIAVPPAFSGEQADSGDIGAWWSAFGDPVLDDLIARAQQGNLDIRIAASRIDQARVQERIAGAAGVPTVNASGQAGYTRLSENSFPTGLINPGNPGNSGGGTPGSAIGLPGESFPTFQVGFDASWELDLFGGQRRASEAARARTEAAEWSRRDAEVTLAAEVANTYQQYRALQRRIAIADALLAAGREELDFVRVRTTNGLVNTIDERRREQDLEQRAAQREDLAAQADTRRHALATLLGLAPTALDTELATAPPPAPAVIAVPVGLPSELLQRRPDIRAAERRIAAATADVGVATADLYPKISLTGALQLVSRSLATLLESDSILASGFGGLSVPLFDPARRETVHLREAEADEALIAYQSDVLGALRDVEDALTRLAADRERADRLRAAADAAADAADTAAVRQRNGLVTAIEVLEARQILLSARDAQAQAEAAAAQDVIALYKALGGGWDERRAVEEELASGGGS